MKKIVRLTEKDIHRMVKRALNELNVFNSSKEDRLSQEKARQKAKDDPDFETIMDPETGEMKYEPPYRYDIMDYSTIGKMKDDNYQYNYNLTHITDKTDYGTFRLNMIRDLLKNVIDGIGNDLKHVTNILTNFYNEIDNYSYNEEAPSKFNTMYESNLKKGDYHRNYGKAIDYYNNAAYNMSRMNRKSYDVYDKIKRLYNYLRNNKNIMFNYFYSKMEEHPEYKNAYERYYDSLMKLIRMCKEVVDMGFEGKTPEQLQKDVDNGPTEIYPAAHWNDSKLNEMVRRVIRKYIR